MEKNIPESPQDLEGLGSAPESVPAVSGGEKGAIREEEFISEEVPFVPDDVLELAPTVIVPSVGLSGGPNQAPFSPADGTGALQRQFEDTESTDAGVARRTVIEFRRLQEGEK